MIEINIERVEMNAEQMLAVVEQGERVRETPHLGGPYDGKYAFSLGGAATDAVIVDTIKAARDTLGKTQDVDGVRLVSNTAGEQKLAAAMNNITLSNDHTIKLDGVMKNLGIDDMGAFVSDGVMDLVGLHTYCAEVTASEAVAVQTFADMWRSNGEITEAMMQYLAVNGMFNRWYNADIGKVRDLGDADQEALLRDESTGTYFDDVDRVHGLLPTVESMLAIEPVLAVIEGRDVTYEHLYKMSTKYTQDPEIVERIRSIARGTLELLGVTTASVDYRLIVADNELLDAMFGRENHFDMMRQGRRFDARLLLRQSLEQDRV